jgi:hypothetical protein
LTIDTKRVKNTFVRDNGTGFDMQHQDKPFSLCSACIPQGTGTGSGWRSCSVSGGMGDLGGVQRRQRNDLYYL